MKGESAFRKSRPSRVTVDEAEAMALEVLGRLAADGERLGRFLALSGLDPRTLRSAAADPGFLPAVLDYVASDEPLLLEIARETGRTAESLVTARHILSPDPDEGA